MKNLLLSTTIVIALFSTNANAQLHYGLTYTDTSTYASLSGGTSINGSTVWNNSNRFSVPIGFPFVMDGKTITNFNIVAGRIIATDTTGNVEGFILTDANLIDKGGSTISYVVTGSPGSRIFEAEIYNAGFAAEQGIDGTYNDFVDLQIWLYETSNIAEIHIGPSMISHTTGYFKYNMPVIGYATNYNVDSDIYYNAYILAGNPKSPSIDSINRALGDTTDEALLLYPLSGMVYRFDPEPAAVPNLFSQNSYRVYPTICQNEIIVTNYRNTKTEYTMVSINGAATNISGLLHNGDTHIDVATLPTGMYLLHLQNANGCSVQKFIKQ